MNLTMTIMTFFVLILHYLPEDWGKNYKHVWNNHEYYLHNFFEHDKNAVK